MRKSIIVWSHAPQRIATSGVVTTPSSFTTAGVMMVQTAAFQKKTHKRIDNVIYKSRRYLAESTADYNADCHIKHIAASDELFEICPEC